MREREGESQQTRRRLLMGGLGAIAAVGGGGLLMQSAPASRRYPNRTPIRYWHMWTAEWELVVRRIVERFNQSQERYEVLPLSIPGDGADAKFTLAVTGGDPPDVMTQWNPVIAPWAESHLLMPLDELMSPSEYERFQRTSYPIVKKIGTYRGHLYALATGLDIFACYYRLDHLREARLDPDRFPQTLDELTVWGDRLLRYDSAHNLTRLGFLPQTQSFIQFAPLFGGGFYDATTQQVTLRTPANLRALTYIADCRRKLGFQNVLRFTSGLPGDTGGGADWPFVSGAYAITLDGQWRVEQLAKFAPHLPYRTAPLPPPSGGQAYAGWSNSNLMIVPRGSKHPEGAWEFMRFWAGLEQPERAAAFYTWGGWMPISDAIAHAPAFQAYLHKYPAFRTFLALLPSEYIQPTPLVPYQAYLMDRITRTEDLALRGTLSPEQALAQLETDITRERARRKALGYPS